MAFNHGRLTVVIFNLVNISAFTNTAEMSDEDEMHEVTCFGAARKAYSAGLGDGIFTLSGVHNSGVTGPRKVMKSVKATKLPAPFIFRPEGTGSGKAQSSVSTLVKSYIDTNSFADMVRWKATLQMTGDLDETDQP